MTGLSTISFCPDCSRELQFASAHTHLIRCRICGSILYRQIDGSLEKKAIPLVRLHSSVIEVGARGNWRNQPFTVLGRMFAWFDDTAFNYFTIRFDDQSIALLAEGYGLMLVMKETDQYSGVNWKLGQMQSGEMFTHADESFVCACNDAIVDWEMEGEIWLRYMVPKIKVLEVFGTQGSVLLVFDFGVHGQKVFECFSTYLSALNLDKTSYAATTPVKVTCQHCHYENSVTGFPFVQSISCVKCGRYHAYNYLKGWILLPKSGNNVDAAIPLLSTGVLQGKKYTIIGHIEKRESRSGAKWREYSLFATDGSFATLSEYNGHWILVDERIPHPVLMRSMEQNFNFNSTYYSIFNRYGYEVVGAKGCFPANQLNSYNAQCREYINPPEMWIEERVERREIVWYHGQHVSKSDIETGFPDAVLPYQIGVGAVEPTGDLSLKQIFMGTLVAAAFLLLIYMMSNLGKTSQKLYEGAPVFPDTADVVNMSIPAFTLNKAASNIEIAVAANVNNSWMEVAVTLVNTTTGTEYGLEQGVEYYSGYTDGESWSEGSKSEEAYFSALPPGRYILTMQGTRQPGSGLNNYAVTITADVTNPRNFWWPFGLLVGFGTILFFMAYRQEAARWSESPYNPYPREED